MPEVRANINHAVDPGRNPGVKGAQREAANTVAEKSRNNFHSAFALRKQKVVSSEPAITTHTRNGIMSRVPSPFDPRIAPRKTCPERILISSSALAPSGHRSRWVAKRTKA